MTVWIIEPVDPLIVRDGRPFNATPGARAKTLDFPFPSTIAGGVRTRAGQDANGRFDEKLIPQVKKISIRGPVLVELEDKQISHFLVPAPADALLFGEKERFKRHHLAPIEHDLAATDLPSNLTYMVGMPTPNNEKPAKEAPSFWYWDKFVTWLLDPADDYISLQKLGHSGPDTTDRRVHVAIDPHTFTGIDGDLFATNGLTFWHKPKADVDKILLSQVKQLALATAVDNLGNLSIEPGLAPLGGERRLMHWQVENKPFLNGQDDKKDKIIQRITTAGHCRVVLLTPAYFDAGWRPASLEKALLGVKTEIMAAVVGQPQVVSGWDFAKRQAKPTRRLAPAGSVYYLKLDGTPDAIEAWVKAHWLTCISDTHEANNDGFGLAALGTWSGSPLPIQFKEEQQDG